MNNNISLPDLRAFVTIAEHGSFTKAAEQLGSSRAHLSRQLNQLEKQLGVQLMTRTTRSQQLSHAGKQLFERCQQALNSIDQAILDTQDESQQLTGKVRLNCVGGIIGEEIVAPLLARFAQSYHDIELELDFSSQRVDLIKDQFDLVIRMGVLPDSGLIARPLGTVDIDLLASPDYLLRAPQLNTPEDLKQHNCLTGTIKRWQLQDIDDSDNSVELTVQGNFSCSNGRSLLHAALAGNGIVRLPRLYCQKEINDGRLQQVFSHWQPASVPLYLLYHKNPFQPERLQVLIDFIRQHFKQHLN